MQARRNHYKPYYEWSRELLEVGKQRLAGDTTRQATSDEVKNPKKELDQMKMMVVELSLRNRVLKQNLLGQESPLDD